ncbi:MAG TPA: hypothetical protein VF768_00250 [Holophagaceae bacterium]
MNDATVRAILARLEAWLKASKDPLDPAFLEAWNREFQAAQATAERGPEWPDLVAWAHRLADQVDQRRRTVESQREEVRLELQRQAQGQRALQGYGGRTRGA